MAVTTGRGFAAIEYPTGMNQNGDPSQAWIKVKPDGRIDVFAGTSDIGNGSKTIQSQIVAETIGVPIRLDHLRQLEHRLVAGLHRHVRLAGDVRRGQGRREGRRADARRRSSRSPARSSRSIRPTSRSSTARCVAKGAPQTKISRRRRRRGGDLDVRRADHRHRRAAEAVRDDRRPRDGQRRPPAPLGDLVRHLRGRGRGRRRDRRSSPSRGSAQCYDVGKAINPTHVEGQIEGGAMQGLGLGVLENVLPVLPVASSIAAAQFGSYLAPGMADLPQIDTIIIENPSYDGPYGAKAIGEMANNAAAARDRDRGARRGRRLGHRAPDHAGARAAGARGQGERQRRAAPRRQVRRSSTRSSRSNAVGDGAITFAGRLMAIAVRIAGTASSPGRSSTAWASMPSAATRCSSCRVDLRARHDGRSATSTTHTEQADADRRRLARDDDRRRDAAAGRRATSPSSTAASSTSCTRRTASRSSRRSRPCRSITCPIASAISCSATWAARSTSSSRRARRRWP